MQTQDILTKPISYLLKQMAIPASTGIIFNTLYNVVDTFYAGGISTNALAGLSISFFLYFMIIGVGYGFSSALTALIANALGKQKDKLASIFAHKGVVFIVYLGILVGLFGYIFSKELLILAGAKSSYLPYAMEYIDLILLASPFFLLNAGFNAVLISKGDTKTYRNVLIVGFFANLILDPLFIYGIDGIGAMGIGGIAISTVLIQIFASIFMGYKAIKTGLICSKNIYFYLPTLFIYRQILNQGTPPALNMLTMSLGSVIIIHFVTTYGMDAVAGFGIAFRVEQIMLLPALGLNSAVLSIVSNNFGAKLYHRVRKTIYLSVIAGGVISVIGLILTFSIGTTIVGLFSHNEYVIKYAMDYLYIEIFNLFGYVVLFICVSTLQGIKRPKVIFYVGLYRQIIAIVPIFWLISTYFELPYIYLWFGLMFVIYSSATFMALYTKKQITKL